MARPAKIKPARYPTDIHWSFPEDKAEIVEHRLRDGYLNGRFARITNYHKDGNTSIDVLHSSNFPNPGYSIEEADSVVRDYIRTWKEWHATPHRTKVEMAPWYADAADSYFESHAKVWGLENHRQAWDLGFHVSKKEGRDYTILTMRSRDPRPTFELNVQMGLSYLMNAGIRVGSTQVEYCVRDDNEARDAAWLA